MAHPTRLRLAFLIAVGASISTFYAGDAHAEPKTPVKQPHLPILDVSLGVHAFRRGLSYKDDIFNALPQYHITAPCPFLAVEWYPLAKAPGVVGNIGVTGSFESAVGVSTPYAVDGKEQSFGAKAYQVTLGARLRVPFGASEIGLSAEYGNQVFAVGLPAPTSTDARVPDVDYKYVRPGLSARWSLSDAVALTVGIGYRFVLSAGEIISDGDGTPTYFRKSTTSVAAVDGNLGAALRITD